MAVLLCEMGSTLCRKSPSDKFNTTKEQQQQQQTGSRVSINNNDLHIEHAVLRSSKQQTQ